MEYLDFSKEMARQDVKRGKNSINTWRCILYINLTAVVLNLSFTWHDHNFFNALCAGFSMCIVIWVSSHLSSSKQEFKFDKERLLHLENMIEEKNIDGIMRQLDETKKYYEDYARYQNSTNATYPENKKPESTSPTVGKS